MRYIWFRRHDLCDRKGRHGDVGGEGGVGGAGGDDGGDGGGAKVTARAVSVASQSSSLRGYGWSSVRTKTQTRFAHALGSDGVGAGGCGGDASGDGGAGGSHGWTKQLSSVQHVSLSLSPVQLLPFTHEVSTLKPGAEISAELVHVAHSPALQRPKKCCTWLPPMVTP